MTSADTFRYDDGGRAAAGFKGSAGDCVARSVAIASGRPYSEVYAALAKIEGARRGNTKGATARSGIHTKREPFKAYLRSLGFEWTPTMTIGSGCKVHLRADELPKGRLVVSVSKHYTAVIDGVIHDTFDPSDRPATIYCVTQDDMSWVPKGAKRRDDGTYIYKPERCVYGYWRLSSAISEEKAKP